MDLSAYSSDELREFESILNAALAEALANGIHIPVGVMARRLFAATRDGERDPERLKEVALGADVVQEFPYHRVSGPRTTSKTPAA